MPEGERGRGIARASDRLPWNVGYDRKLRCEGSVAAEARKNPPQPRTHPAVSRWGARGAKPWEAFPSLINMETEAEIGNLRGVPLGRMVIAAYTIL